MMLDGKKIEGTNKTAGPYENQNILNLSQGYYTSHELIENKMGFRNISSLYD